MPPGGRTTATEAMSRWELPSLPDLSETLRQLLNQVPAGCVTTFGDLALHLGDIQAARWVAEILRSAPADYGPVHRVVRKSGELPQGSTQREQLLAEGCPMLSDGRVDLALAAYPLQSQERPLQILSAWQNRLGESVSLVPPAKTPSTLGGIDVSYRGTDEASAAYASVDLATGQLRWSCLIRGTVTFPYLPGYLTFREAPIVLKLIDVVRQQQALDGVILVDGSGRLHPRRAGIAVAIGLLADCVTVGVSKHQLCGRVSLQQLVHGCPAIELNGELVGAKLDGGSKRRTLFVSPGQGIDLATAVCLTRRAWHSERLPLPIWHADRLSRAALQSANSCYLLSR